MDLQVYLPIPVHGKRAHWCMAGGPTKENLPVVASLNTPVNLRRTDRDPVRNYSQVPCVLNLKTLPEKRYTVTVEYGLNARVQVW